MLRQLLPKGPGAAARCAAGRLLRVAGARFFGAALLAMLAWNCPATLVAPPTIWLGEPYDTGTDVVAWLNWDDVNSAQASYGVEASTNATLFTQIGRTGIGEKTYKLRIPYGVRYWVRVRALSGVDASGFSPTAQVVGVAPPSRLSAMSTNVMSALLTWRDNSLNEEGFIVERSRDSGATFTSVVTTASGETSFQDTAVQFGECYQYRVSAFVSAGRSSPTSPVAIAPGLPPDPPIDVEAYTINESANGTSSTSVLVAWKDASLTETGWRIDQRSETSAWVPIGSYSYTYSGNSHTVRGLTPGTVYYFRVCSTNSAGDSSPVVARVEMPSVPASRQSSARIWYIDAAAASSDLSGQSWANAWRDFSSINWRAIQPGDTVFISGGTSAEIYTNALHIGACGTPEKPIPFRVGTEAGHSGRVIIQAGVSFHQSRWITIDGAKNPAFVLGQVVDLPSNINLEVRNPKGTGIYATTPQGLKINWVEIHETGATSQTGYDHGIRLNATDPNFQPQGVEIAYCHIHHNWVDGINVPVNTEPSYGEVAVHHNLIEHNGDDGIQIAGGVDVHDNIIRKRRLAGGTGHPDGIQTGGSYYRIYNNLIYDFGNALIFMEVSRPTNGFIHIYNNVFAVEETEPPYGISLTCNALGVPGGYIANMENSEIHIINNTFVGLPSAAITLARSSSNEVGLINMRSSRVANNIIHNCSYSFSSNGSPISLKGEVGSGFSFSVQDFPFDGNVVSGPCKRIQYLAATPHATAEALNQALGLSLNTSITPVFVAPLAQDFHLAPEDTSATGRGADLSTLLGGLPSLTRDKDGKLRPGGKAWDAGAFNSSKTPRPSVPGNLRVVAQN